MVEEEAYRPMEGRRGEVRGTRFQMPGCGYPNEKRLRAIQRSPSSDFGARHVSINGSDSTFFSEKEPAETQELKLFRANLNLQAANDGRPRAKKKRAASRSCSALGQGKAARPRNMKTFQRGAKEKGAAWKKGATCLPALYFGVAIWTVFIGGSEAAANVITTRQNLPPDCLQLLKEHHDDCPDRADFIFVSLWNKLNSLCCGNYPGKFHCQFINEGGTTYSMVACLQNQTIPAGKLGLLTRNNSGYPKLDIDSDCPNGTFRSQPIDSTFARFWYCDSTKTKGEAGEEKWCDGGPSANDLFICRMGYYAENCPHGHNSHDSCTCLLVKSCNGSQPFRNVTGNCDNNSINVTYGCTFPVSTVGMSASTPSYQSSSSASGDGEINSNHNYVYLGLVLGVVGLFMIVVSVFFCWKLKRNSDLPEQEEMMSDSGSSSKDDSISLDMLTESE